MRGAVPAVGPGGRPQEAAPRVGVDRLDEVEQLLGRARLLVALLDRHPLTARRIIWLVGVHLRL